MWLKIKPLDVLLFRISKPFGAGESFRAEGVFPPTSIPFIGALRSRIIAHLMGTNSDKQLDGDQNEKTITNIPDWIFEEIGTYDNLGPLSIEGPYLVIDDINCLPIPRDLMKSNNDNMSEFLSCLQPGFSNWPVITSKPNLEMPLITSASDYKAESCTSGFLIGKYLENYLTAELSINLIYNEAVSDVEPRLGISLSKDRTTKKGFIYNVLFNRLRDNAAFWLKLNSKKGNEDSLLPKSGFLALGGESRAAYFEKVNNENLPESIPTNKSVNELKNSLSQKLTGKKEFKLYLLSPAVFEQGWLPDFVNNEDHTWEPVPGVQTKLVSAAVGKALTIGGWDLAKNLPKPINRAVPAGSVYYFESKESFSEITAKTIVDTIHMKSIIQNESNNPLIQSAYYRSAGFGITAVGSWTTKEEYYV